MCAYCMMRGELREDRTYRICVEARPGHLGLVRLFVRIDVVVFLKDSRQCPDLTPDRF